MPFVLLLPLAAALLTPPLSLDGDRQEWAEVPVAAADPRGDAKAPADGARIMLDLGEVRLAETNDAIWILAEIATHPVNPQNLPEPSSLEIAIDADGSPATGSTRGSLEGSDLVLRWSPRGEGVSRAGRGTMLEILEDSIAVLPPRSRNPRPQQLGIGVAPSSASRWIELRIPRSFDRADGEAAPGIRFGKEARVLVRAVGSGGETLDETPIATLSFVSPAAEVLRPSKALADDTPANLRVMSWNAERGALFKNPEPFAEVFRAIGPDVVLLQELEGVEKAKELEAWFDERLPTPGGWRAVLGGGSLAVAVVSPKVAALPELADVERALPNGSRPVRVVGGVVPFGARRVLVASVHLKCCGSIGSREDETREQEAFAIREAIRRAMEEAAKRREPIDGIVIGGDFNLVGSPHIVDLAAEGLDLDRSPLTAASLYGVDGLANLTWRDGGSEFMPGQLDFLLFSDSRLDLADGMVIDPAAILPRGGSADGPSDHLPIVIDLRWKAMAERGR
ncbi:MAG: endonuclease/exonuclease/phosphatase family protein [Phycisphaerales bacterium]